MGPGTVKRFRPAGPDLLVPLLSGAALVLGGDGAVAGLGGAVSGARAGAAPGLALASACAMAGRGAGPLASPRPLAGHRPAGKRRRNARGGADDPAEPAAEGEGAGKAGRLRHALDRGGVGAREFPGPFDAQNGQPVGRGLPGRRPEMPLKGARAHPRGLGHGGDGPAPRRFGADAVHRRFQPARGFAFETDCRDVYQALGAGADFVLPDVRSPALFARGHIPGAVSLPHRRITARRMADRPGDTVFVSHCAGPHCNGAARAALRLARLGRPVKIMAGGVTGWLDEGFALAAGR